MISDSVELYEGDEAYIFISYSHKNSREVVSIVERMVNDGFRVWYDQGINPGTEWDVVVAEHVEKCEVFLSFVSQEYLDSSNCLDELDYARNLEKKRSLIYLQDVELPGRLKMRHSRIQNLHKYAYRGKEDKFFLQLYKMEGLDSCNAVPLSSLVSRVEEKKPELIKERIEVPTIGQKAMPAPLETTETPAVTSQTEYTERPSAPVRPAKETFGLNPGEIIEFGHYPQDSMDPTPLRWIVLKTENGKALLLSRNIIDCIQYNNQYRDVNWENCSMRRWLNSVFIDEAFTPAEQSSICLTRNENKSNSIGRVFGGMFGGTATGMMDAGQFTSETTTNDYVFCLSIAEARSILGLEQVKAAEVTKYAEMRGCRPSFGMPGMPGGIGAPGLSFAFSANNYTWWLRSPGVNNSSAAQVETVKYGIDYRANINERGSSVMSNGCGIRPAIWIAMD